MYHLKIGNEANLKEDSGPIAQTRTTLKKVNTLEMCQTRGLKENRSIQ
jgi:hypothetical protein